MKKKKAVEEGKHDCTFTVTIAKASEADQDLLQSKERGRTTTRHHEAIKAQTYFHCSYKLLPGEKEHTKTDVVTFGVAAKLYAENESRVLRTWTEGKLTWVAWQNSHKIEVAKDTLLKLFDHAVEVKMWDSKERVSTKARFDRPKGFKLPQSRGSDEVDFMHLREILEKEDMLVEDFPKTPCYNTSAKQDGSGSRERTDRPCSGKKKVVISDPSNITEDKEQRKGVENKWKNQDEINVKVNLDESNKLEFSKLLALASSGLQDSLNDDEQESSETGKGFKESPRGTGHDSRASKGKAASSSRQGKRKKNEQQALYIHQHGLATVRLEMSQFFTGTTTIVNKLMQPAGTIESLIVTITLDCPLLSLPQKKILNPMVLTLNTISNLPNGHIKDNGEDRYEDTYACYRFFGGEKHYSRGLKHSKKIHLNDKHVVLLGTLSKEKLLEYLQGPPLDIEIHDRDRRWPYKREKCQAFGTQEGDMLIGDVSYLSGLNMARNPFLGKKRPWDPYGVCKVDLSGILDGEKFIDVAVPICSCPLPDPLLTPTEIGDKGIHPANYLESGSELKMRIEVAYPITKTHETLPENEKILIKAECPLNRIIYIFNYNNGKLLRQLLSELMQINAQALNLDGNRRDALEAALSTYKLTDIERSSRTLDIITGFQVVDGNFHIFVLEGLQEGGISRLWNTLPQGFSDGVGVIQVAYNSNLMFSERLYVSLDVDITRVRLHKPLSTIVQQPLLYVRDMVPKPCYEAVVKLHELTKTPLIKDAVRNSLFPSAESIVSLSKEFGIPLTHEDVQELESRVEIGITECDTELSGLTTTQPKRTIKTSRAWTPIEYRNFDYEETLEQRKVQFLEKNFVEANKLQVGLKQPEKPPETTLSCDLKELHLQRAHNYSIQSMNSSVKAKDKLRNELKHEPEALFTYSKEYQSATFEPVDIDELRKREKALSKKMWQTDHGFVFPGMKTFRESNVHPRKPDFARLEEIQKPWKENILHANILKPTVDRIVFPWDLREDNFDVLKPPVPYFGTKMPTTIFLTGDTLRAEQREASETDKKIWKNKLVVDDPAFYTHRCLTSTELTEKGFYSSSQLSRLDDLLKGQAKKFSLAAKGMKLEKMPALSVIVRTKEADLRAISAPAYQSSKELSSTPNYSPYQRLKGGLDKRRLHSVEYCGNV